MPGYIKKYLQQFKYPELQKVEDAPTLYNNPYFGAKQQWADNASTLEILEPSTIKHVKSIVGNVLYYDIAVDSIIMV